MEAWLGSGRIPATVAGAPARRRNDDDGEGLPRGGPGNHSGTLAVDLPHAARMV